MANSLTFFESSDEPKLSEPGTSN